MTVTNGIKKLSKLGKVEKNDCGEYWVIVKDSEGKERNISFMVNGREEPGANLCCINVRRTNDHSDSMTDYSAGSFYPNLSQAIGSALN